MPDPFFSLIVPTYNRAGLIGKTIGSVLSQQFTDFELIIVDDGSTDHTEEIVKGIKDPRIFYYKKENAERGAARNFGVKHAKGKYISFLDSDDLLYANHFSVAFDFISNHSPEIFHLAYQIVSPAGKVLQRMDSIKNINSEIISGNPLSCLGVFVKRGIIIENLFVEDRQLAGLEDWELWLRISRHYKFQNSNQITSAIVQHSQRSVIVDSKERLKAKTKAFLFYATENAANQKFYGKQLAKTKASIYTYTALHLAMVKANRKETLQYLIIGLKENLREIFRKRFFVILKLLLLR